VGNEILFREGAVSCQKERDVDSGESKESSRVAPRYGPLTNDRRYDMCINNKSDKGVGPKSLSVHNVILFGDKRHGCNPNNIQSGPSQADIFDMEGFVMSRLIDLTGKRFGRLVVERRHVTNAPCGDALWDCVCDCGESKALFGCHLRSGATKSCGCLNREFASRRCLVDLTGKRFGRLMVKGRHPKNSSTGSPLWDCICDCGDVTVVWGKHLRRSATKSCGCLQRELAIKANTTHGEASGGELTRELVSWRGLKNRCLNMNAEKWENYGGRGIKICDRWKDDFKNFLEDMGRRPEGCSSIDRIDNDGDYEPGNCRWATHKQQAGNTTRSVWIENGGERQIKADWLREVGVNGNVWDKIKNRHDFTESETLNHFMENRGPM